MRVLLIKTSSMGDIIHTLPALTDALAAIPNLQVDWVVENNFAVIPSWHPAVVRTIPFALRQYRKKLFSKMTRQAIQDLKTDLSLHPYDIILDAQGLLKSAWFSFLAKGERVGLGFSSAKEGLSALAYQRRCTVNFYQHAVTRMRLLFSLSLKYPLPQTAPDFAIAHLSKIARVEEKYLVFLPGTSWQSKLWPVTYWIQLANTAAECGYQILMSGVSEQELFIAEQIAAACSSVKIMPHINIDKMATLFANASGIVAVDTGLAHLAAAMDKPVVTLYGATSATYTGVVGAQAVCLSADFACSPCLSRICKIPVNPEQMVRPPCYGTLQPLLVWQKLMALIKN